MPPTWTVERNQVDVLEDDVGLYYTFEEEPRYIEPVPIANSVLLSGRVAGSDVEPPITEEHVVSADGAYYRVDARRHWGWWSLLPPLVAVLLCWITKEPVTSLLGGIAAGAMILGNYDLTGEVLIPSLATTKVAGLIVLYLWLLGGLMGIWSRTGAARPLRSTSRARWCAGRAPPSWWPGCSA